MVSCGVLTAVDPFAGPSTGVLILFWLSLFALGHLVALILGFFLKKKGNMRLLIVAGLALVPAGLLILYEVVERWHLRN